MASKTHLYQSGHEATVAHLSRQVQHLQEEVQQLKKKVNDLAWLVDLIRKANPQLEEWILENLATSTTSLSPKKPPLHEFLGSYSIPGNVVFEIINALSRGRDSEAIELFSQAANISVKEAMEAINTLKSMINV